MNTDNEWRIIGLHLSKTDIGDWVMDGAFAGSDGRLIQQYDDVLLERPTRVTGGVRADVQELPAGATGTVLMFTDGPQPIAQLECAFGQDGFTFGYQETAHLKLFRTTKEKWPD